MRQKVNSRPDMEPSLGEHRQREEVAGVATDLTYHRLFDGQWQEGRGPLIQELPLTIYLNQEELVTILCTPQKLNCLVIGFLFSEGFIASVDEIALMRVCAEDFLAEVRLNHPLALQPRKRVLTSGCGGGVGFTREEGIEPLDTTFKIEPSRIFPLMHQLQEAGEINRLCGGVHVSALSDGEKLLVVAEDVGRHNTLDKIQGECLLLNIPTRDRLLLTTGRISSEMLLKAAKMKVPLVASRNSPTDNAIKMAQELGIAVVGYVRQKSLMVYSNPWRLHGGHD